MIVLVFGATGSAGASVTTAALAAPDVSEVRVIVRRPLKRTHPKLRVVQHENFLDFGAASSAFTGVDACFYCLGVSVSQVPDENDYRRITKDFAVAAATLLKAKSPLATFHFVSGSGTKAGSRVMWARVKGEAEQAVTDIADAVCYRPGAIDGEPTDSATKPWYAGMRPLFWVFMPFRSLYLRGEDLGRAMLLAAREGMRRRVLENTDIRDLADRAHSASQP